MTKLAHPRIQTRVLVVESPKLYPGAIALYILLTFLVKLFDRWYCPTIGTVTLLSVVFFVSDYIVSMTPVLVTPVTRL